MKCSPTLTRCPGTKTYNQTQVFPTSNIFRFTLLMRAAESSNCLISLYEAIIILSLLHVYNIVLRGFPYFSDSPYLTQADIRSL